jgi:uncharacterized protein
VDVIQSEALSGPAERDRVLRLLREREIELRRRGVTRLKLFGSIARGEAAGASDVDLIAEIDRGSGFSLIELSGLRLDLGEVIGREVQILTTPEKLRAWVQDSIARDTIEVF